MELTYYLSILWRRKWLILLSAILAGGLAYYIVSLKPPVYKSEAKISTGVIDYTGINSGKNNPFIQQLQVDMRFNNLTEFMTSRRCVNLLSFHLLTHDLQSEEFGDGPYRTVEGLANIEVDQDLFELNQLLTTKLEQLKPEFDKPEAELYFNQIAKKFEYDYETLKENHLKIQRTGATDYVTVSFESEKAELSTFAASKFSQVFIDYFESLRTSENEETLNYLGETARDKKRTLAKKQTELKEYESKKGLVDLESQREATVNQIKDLEQLRNTAQSTVAASNKTIKNLARLIDENAPALTKTIAEDSDNAATLMVNKKILKLQEQVKEIRNNIIDGVGNSRKNKSRLKSVRKQLEQEVKALAKLKKEEILENEQVDDNTIANELFGKHLDAKLNLTNAQEEITIIDKKLKELQTRSLSYVSNQAYVINLEREIEAAKKDYDRVVSKLEEERLEKNGDDNPLTIIEHAQLPEEAESDRKLLFTAFSGVVGASMTTFFIFLLSFLDNTMHSPNQFKVFTGLPLVGNITKIDKKKLDLINLFGGDSGNPAFERFKELVRDFRFNIEKVEKGNIFLMTSPREDEGKSFLITVLSHALLLKQKRVIVIDTNFKRNTLSTWAAKPLVASSEIHQLLVDAKLTEHFAVTSIASPFNNNPIESISNSGRSQSPLEGLNENAFKDFLAELSSRYDYIFMEGAALNEYSDTKELIDFSDNVIAVFSSDSTLKQADKDSIAFLNSLGDKFVGAALNRINKKNMS